MEECCLSLVQRKMQFNLQYFAHPQAKHTQRDFNHMGFFPGPFSLLNQHEPAGTNAGLQPREATGGTSLPVELQSYCSDSFSVKRHICLLKPALELSAASPLFPA